MTGGVCFVDCETTGLDPDRHEIWEVGLILPDGSEHLWQLPVDLSRADPIALNIGRFHDRRHPDLFEAMSRGEGGGLGESTGRLDRTLLGDTNEAFVVPVDFMRQWAATFVDLTRGLHVVGACISFDDNRLWRLIRLLGECPMWHYHLIDVENLAAGWLAGHQAMHSEQSIPTTEAHDPRPPWKSDDLSRAVGVNPDDFDRHTALGDARWAKAIYEAVMGT